MSASPPPLGGIGLQPVTSTAVSTAHQPPTGARQPSAPFPPISRSPSPSGTSSPSWLIGVLTATAVLLVAGLVGAAAMGVMLFSAAVPAAPAPSQALRAVAADGTSPPTGAASRSQPSQPPRLAMAAATTPPSTLLVPQQHQRPGRQHQQLSRPSQPDQPPFASRSRGPRVTQLQQGNAQTRSPRTEGGVQVNRTGQSADVDGNGSIGSSYGSSSAGDPTRSPRSPASIITVLHGNPSFNDRGSMAGDAGTGTGSAAADVIGER